ncbi:acetyl-CoA C-acyltransferase [Paenibacillus radicis (ex Gao et al. 2016)]|uniref:acetyl-CoA C-acyltransferase n=1 Tax=Paenibacillus radicis (ex Gao et al. 2016) TaxID=1737354 RepID=A0A917H324_9BACL|nr:acetyl-CoA C-acyltransferase [Paenibacillus radicis (ex Gao et al. 2016)]GGG65957.1 3-ketoacyl-CoA thiolase [Paenibacillus radicis (ex Gao et al. 2016)]
MGTAGKRFAEDDRDAVIVSAVRTAVGKAKKGSLADTRAEDLGRAVLRAALERAPGLAAEEVEDVIIGCAMPEGEQGLNMARVISLYAGFPVTTPAVTVNRFCASGLQAIAYAAERIRLGEAEVIAAGGVESMSHVPMTGFKMAPHPGIVDSMPEVYMGMGHTAEEVARRYGVSRTAQDAFAASSHRKAAAAIQDGRFKEEIVPVTARRSGVNEAGRPWESMITFDTDEGVRPDTTPEALASLKPSFAREGTVTAGNASQMSDGAAAVIVMSRARARELGLQPLAALRSFSVAGVAPEVMGIGPIEAVPKALAKAGVELGEVDLFELNEAFAAQCVPIIEQLGIDPDKVNVNGGAIALGHPLGCTGTKLSVSLIHELRRRGGGLGVVTMCIGGGMGAAGLFEVYP